MSQKFASAKEPAEEVVRNIRRATRRRYSGEEKIRNVLEGLRDEEAEPRRAIGLSDNSEGRTLPTRGGISRNFYYRWSEEFLEAGKKRLAGDARREARRVK